MSKSVSLKERRAGIRAESNEAGRGQLGGRRQVEDHLAGRTLQVKRVLMKAGRAKGQTGT